MLFYTLLLLAGFVCLWKGGDYLVEGAIDISKSFHIPEFIVGLTIVAFGTSAPELVVNSIASLKGKSDIIFGNILGSNIANILLILGVSSALYPITIKQKHINKNIMYSILAIILMMVFINNPYNQALQLNRLEGLLLLVGFCYFLYRNYQLSRKESDDTTEETTTNRLKASLICVGGIILLSLGGKWVVDAAIYLAHHMGISEAFISLFAVALGTSLPELVASCIAAVKKKPAMAVGNVIGSNIFNILLILSISSLIRPITFNPILWLECGLIITLSLLLMGFINAGKENKISRVEGLSLLVMYGGYITYITLRG